MHDDIIQEWSWPVPLEVEAHAQLVWNFLSEEDVLPPASGNELIFVSGNWYGQGKAQSVAELSEIYPEARIVLAGGYGRLAGKRAEELGGEAIEMMQDHLRSHAIDPSKRIVVYTGGDNTEDNVRFLIWFRKEKYTNKQVIFVDESYLLRRVRATILGEMIRKGQQDARILHGISSTTRSYEDLVALHNNRPLVAIHLMVAESDRLNAYSTPGNKPYLFARPMAYLGAKKFGGEEAITQSIETIRTAHDYEEGRRILGDPGYGVPRGGKNLALELFAPRYSS